MEAAGKHRSAGGFRQALEQVKSCRFPREGNPGGGGISVRQPEDPSSITERQIIAFEHYLLQFNCIDLLSVQ